MFFDIGSIEFIALIILAILVFGPEKLPKFIQDTARVLRKVREFSENAKRDIREELGPEFKDFEFEDLNPRTFARKHLMDNDDLGLKELRSSIDVRKELTEVSDAVNGRTPAARKSSGTGTGTGQANGSPAVNLEKDPGGTAGTGTATGTASGSGSGKAADSGGAPADPPPFDSDAT
ncbi:sec-independent translocase [Streptomyces aidingensis]|uniref:Sec-independent protein translocase protein TatB n=1 Tax=Streptomyces aidingensis TaxID=910347 RepID=A0A1I1EUS3_9ACTN|nr:sec-independent translocase [Streptomyces aidingensis]SFB90909.1 sec-independent protein translocase protein TatB [Streptomyces aidingensis]